MYLIVPALVGWPFVALMIFAVLPGRPALAASISVVGAWLLLPPVTLPFPGLPDYSKTTAAVVGVLLGTLIFAPDRLMSFRPRWFDLPMLLWCLTGIVTSLQNGLGLYDGISDAMIQIDRWGLPYLVGRLHFGDLKSLRTITTAVIIGGICYVPLCLFETRMMMSLLIRIYGTGQWGGLAGLRLGGYRPNVFFATGLELGLYMTAVCLSGWWLWYCGVIKRIGQIGFGPVILPILFATTILCRSSGALLLLVFGMLILYLSARWRTPWLLAGLLLAGPLYVAVRVPNLWSGDQAVDFATAVFGPERSGSLKHRFNCERLLAAKAVQQPFFGWGAFGRSDAHYGTDLRRVDTDAIWIIYLGQKGFVGLSLLYLALIAPALAFVWRFPARLWADPRVAAGTLSAAVLGLYIIDCLMNGFVNIIYVILAGGLVSLDSRQLGARAGSRSAPLGAGSGHDALGALAIEPGSPAGRQLLADRYRSLGRSFKQEGRREQAETAWQHALDVLTGLLEAEPESAELRRQWCDCANDLVWLRANHPGPADRDLNSSVVIARRMVQECPDAEVYWNTLGVVCYRAGDHAAAVAALDRAMALGGGTVFDDVFLAMAHARLGDLEGARTELARALVRAEHDYPGHRELAVFCDEARSIIAHDLGTPAAPH
jgi:tetratricopeptide (TPR) repeat protein